MNEQNRKRILIAEDEPDLQDLISDEFQFSGFETAVASGGHEALSLVKLAVAKNQPFDAVVSDISMPTGDGVSLLKKIQNEVSNPPIFAFISGFSEQTLPQILQLGAVALFPKPCDLEILVKRVATHLMPIKDRLGDLETSRVSALDPKDCFQLELSEIRWGRGGGFYPTTKWFPTLGKPIIVKIVEAAGNFFLEIIPHWNRKIPEKNQPAGIGFEVNAVSSELKVSLLKLLVPGTVGPYIPES